MPIKVLIIDDSAECSFALAQLIRVCWKLPEDEMVIICVATLADGLREGQDANVTILDLELPGSSPEETIEAIPKFRPPVIVLTGYADDALSVKCIAAGATHVYIKGSLMGFIPTFFKALQQDVIRRADERSHET